MKQEAKQARIDQFKGNSVNVRKSAPLKGNEQAVGKRKKSTNND